MSLNNEGERRSLALIDDDDSFRKSIVRLLGAYGWTIRGFSSAVEFLKTIDTERYDCLLIDIHMPVMTGGKLLEAIREKGVQTPAVFISAREPDLAHAETAGRLAQGILAKPCSISEILETFDRACRHPSDCEPLTSH